MSEAARQLREAARIVDLVALTERELDTIELMALHIKDRCSGAGGDRCRTAKLLCRRLDEA